MKDEPLDDRGRAADITLGGDPEIGGPRGGLIVEKFVDAMDVGRESRYQPPVYVKAMS